MVQKTKLPEGTDEIRTARHVYYDDIARDYDQHYGLEDYNALCAEERHQEESYRLELTQRHRQAELALKQEHDGPAMIAAPNNKPIEVVQKNDASTTILKIVYQTSQDTTQKPVPVQKPGRIPLGWTLHTQEPPSERFSKLLQQAAENYEFNARQTDLSWYGQKNMATSNGRAVEDCADLIKTKVAVIRRDYY
jgi:hypothetical protein